MKTLLQELRESKRLTMVEMGNILGISHQCYNNYEKGKTEAPFQIMIKCADYYDVSLDYLLGRSKDKIFLNSFNNNNINSTIGSGDEMTNQLISKFNELSFDDKIKVFTYIGGLNK